jgi:protocatechuate 3,4-dioxygenase beta subunit
VTPTALLPAFACAVSLLAQNASVEGRVTSQSGEVLRRARVSLQPVGGAYRQVRFETDANGNFAFPSVEPGRYWLITTHNGYLNFTSRTPLTVSVGQQITGLQVKLTREGILSGTIVDEGGEPVPTARVNLLNEKWDYLSSAQVRPDGSFVIGDAKAGNYYLSVHDMPQLPIGTRQISGPREGYIETYYPGVTNQAKATLIRVETGAQIHDLNFRIIKSAVSRIRGRVMDGDGAPVREANLELLVASFGFNMGASSSTDGSFEFGQTPPGDYVLTATQGQTASTFRTGHERFTLGTNDIDGVVVHLNPTLTLSGSVMIEGGGSAAGSRIWLDGGEAQWLGGGAADVNADGSYLLQAVEPGIFLVQASVRPPGTYLKSVRFGGELQPGNVLDLTREAPGQDTQGHDTQGHGARDKKLELVLSPHAAQLSGVVHDAKGAIAEGALITLRSAGRDIDTDRTDSSGEFTFRDLAPGGYQLQAGNQEPVPVTLAEDAKAVVNTLVATQPQ